MILIFFVAVVHWIDEKRFGGHSRAIENYNSQPHRIRSAEPQYYYIESSSPKYISPILAKKGIPPSIWTSSYLTAEEKRELEVTGNYSIYAVPPEIKFNLNDQILNGTKTEFIVKGVENVAIPSASFHEIRPIIGDYYSVISQSPYETIELLKNCPNVLYFENHPKMHTFNIWGVGFAQTGTYDTRPYTQISRQFLTGRTIHDKYKGDGQVVTVTDTGLDTNLDFFRDSTHPVPYDTYSSLHRKIVSYRVLVNDKTDVPSGHGTHCAGTVAGNNIIENNMFLYNGHAPNAKLLICDNGDASGELVGNSLTLDQQQDYIQNGNTHISSNSWGYKAQNDNGRVIYDMLGYKFKELIYVFAAGNDYKYHTVSDPSNSKNMLTVGAIDELPTANVETKSKTKLEIEVYDPTTNKFTVYDCTDVGRAPVYENLMSKFIGVSRVEFSTAAAADKVVSGTSCADFTGKNDAAAWIFKGTPTDTSCIPSTGNIPFAVSVSSTSFNPVADQLISIYPVLKDKYPMPDVSNFSSKGPSHFGSVKPEVCAPGTGIFSANAIKGGATKKSGTSMATPAVAGEIAILRQHLATIGIGYPTSPLIRAILVASAEKTNPEVPAADVGFGYIVMTNIIPMNNEFDYKFIDNVTINKDQEIVYTLNLKDTTLPLRIVISWLDQALDPEKTGAALNVDIDLFVEDPAGTIFSPLRDSEDMYSTTERVYIPISKQKLGTYKIHVKNSNAQISMYSSENFSLAVVGRFDTWTQGTSTTWTSQMCIHGTAKVGGCTCQKGYAGIHCNKEILNIISDQAHMITIQPFESVYAKYTLPNFNKNFSFNILASNEENPNYLMKLSLEQETNANSFTQHFSAPSQKFSLHGAKSAGFNSGTTIYVLFTSISNSQNKLQVIAFVDKPLLYSQKAPGLPFSIPWNTVGIAVAIVVVVVAIIAIVYFFIKKKKKGSQVQQSDDL